MEPAGCLVSGLRPDPPRPGSDGDGERRKHGPEALTRHRDGRLTAATAAVVAAGRRLAHFEFERPLGLAGRVGPAGFNGFGLTGGQQDTRGKGKKQPFTMRDRMKVKSHGDGGLNKESSR